VADCGVSRLTAWFTDGEWFNAPEQEDLRACDDRSPDKSGFRGKALPAAVHSLWAWHMRLDNKKDKCLAEDADTLAMVFRIRVREMLSRGLDMNGRAVFPGPGFAQWFCSAFRISVLLYGIFVFLSTLSTGHNTLK